MDNTSTSSLLNDPNSVDLKIENKSVFKKFKEWITRLSGPQISSISIVAITVLVLPAAFFLSQQPFNIRSRADVTTMPVTVPSEPTQTPAPTAEPGCQKTYPQGDLNVKFKVENIDPIFNGTQRLLATWQAPASWGNGCPNNNGVKIRIGRGSSPLTYPLFTSDFKPMESGSQTPGYAINVAEPGQYSAEVQPSNDGGKSYGLIFSASVNVVFPTATPTPSPTPILQPTSTPIPTISLLPAAPTGLSAICSSNGSSVNLSWNPTAGATSYPLRLSNMLTCPPSPWWSYKPGECDLESLTTNSYNNLPVVPGTTYTWWVHVVNKYGWSNSSQGTFKCVAPPTDPKKPAATPTPINYGQGNGSCRRTFGSKATCKSVSSCNGTVKSGYCPGPSSWKCCISR